MNVDNDFNHYASIYWVFTQLCNDTCAHCYNLSGPKGERISIEDCFFFTPETAATYETIHIAGGREAVSIRYQDFTLGNL